MTEQKEFPPERIWIDWPKKQADDAWYWTHGDYGKVEYARALPVQPAQPDRVRWLLHQIISDLPKSRDWLDPQIEAEAREVTGVQLVQPAASTERK